jgi:hypothetical protein
MLGVWGEFWVDTRMNEDGLRRGVPRPKPGDGKRGSVEAMLLVLTIGAGAEEPGTGRMITSPPSKVSAESLELSSVSGMTGSLLTIIGYRAESISRI